MRQYERQITGRSPVHSSQSVPEVSVRSTRAKELSFEDLTAYIGKWRTLKDSVTAAMHRDTAYRTHSDIREECILLHDSVRSELSRLAMSKPRTYKEVLVLKERFSPYAGDVELCRSAEEIRPFSQNWINVRPVGVARSKFCQHIVTCLPKP